MKSKSGCPFLGMIQSELLSWWRAIRVRSWEKSPLDYFSSHGHEKEEMKISRHAACITDLLNNKWQMGMSDEAFKRSGDIISVTLNLPEPCAADEAEDSGYCWCWSSLIVCPGFLLHLRSMDLYFSNLVDSFLSQAQWTGEWGRMLRVGGPGSETSSNKWLGTHWCQLFKNLNMGAWLWMYWIFYALESESPGHQSKLSFPH